MSGSWQISTKKKRKMLAGIILNCGIVDDLYFSFSILLYIFPKFSTLSRHCFSIKKSYYRFLNKNIYT